MTWLFAAVPTQSFEEIGGVFAGQTARVTGQSFVTGWWRVICPDDTVGDCYVSPATADVRIVDAANP